MSVSAKRITIALFGGSPSAGSNEDLAAVFLHKRQHFGHTLAEISVRFLPFHLDQPPVPRALKCKVLDEFTQLGESLEPLAVRL